MGRPKKVKRGAKSEAVRNMLAQMPNASAKEIADRLANEHGLKVSAQMVYSLKGRMKSGKSRSRVAAATSGGRSDGMHDFFAVLDLARKIGVKNLREIAQRLPE